MSHQETPPTQTLHAFQKGVCPCVYIVAYHIVRWTLAQFGGLNRENLSGFPPAATDVHVCKALKPLLLQGSCSCKHCSRSEQLPAVGVCVLLSKAPAATLHREQYVGQVSCEELGGLMDFFFFFFSSAQILEK